MMRWWYFSWTERRWCAANDWLAATTCNDLGVVRLSRGRPRRKPEARKP